jgi:hypothetical protein
VVLDRPPPAGSCPDGATGLTRRPIPAAVDHADPHPALWIIHYDVQWRDCKS